MERSVWQFLLKSPPSARTGRIGTAQAVADLDDLVDYGFNPLYDSSDDEGELGMPHHYNNYNRYGMAAANLDYTLLYAMYYLWRDLFLFASCPFIGIDSKDVAELYAVAKANLPDGFFRALKAVDWHQPLVQEAMTKGESAGGSTALLDVENEDMLKKRITILLIIGRLEEALKIAIAADFHVIGMIHLFHKKQSLGTFN